MVEQRKIRAALQTDKRKAGQNCWSRSRPTLRATKEIGRLKRDENRTKLIEQLSKAIATHRSERKRDSPSEKIDDVADAALAGRVRILERAIENAGQGGTS